MTSAENALCTPRTPRPRGRTKRTDGAACVMAATAATVPVLRRFACRLAQCWDLPPDVEDAVALIVTELATNAVRHSGSSEVALQLTCGDGRLAIEIHDFGRWRTPDREPASEESCSGRGLELVRAFATEYEIRSTGTGTRATAVVLLPSPRQIAT